MNIHLIIYGRVQGVGFRYTAQQKAKEYSLNGWVQNKADGTVELEIEGPKMQVNSYIDELKAGFNPFIHVEHIDRKTNKEKQGYENFTIR